MEKVYLAGGCFWCIEEALYDVEGVISTSCGYMGGDKENPRYEEVCQGNTGHKEVVEISFDPQQITFLQVLDIFWHHIDPFDNGGQFADRGEQYQTEIFYTSTQQKELAKLSQEAVEKVFGKKMATKITPAKNFYRAEENHQLYCQKNPEHYFLYKEGHIDYLKKLWKGKNILLDPKIFFTPLQYKILYEHGTEPPFQNAYWNKHEEGIYVDRISSEPLFASIDKFDSQTGWPSFTKPLKKESLLESEDLHLGYPRTEVRGKKSNSHLGHVFPDGPYPTGLRYCINSASLRFIPKDKLKEEGFETWLYLFENNAE